jgi:hypothetical protein
MTDRIIGIVATLERDFRTDDVEEIASAIRMVRGVKDVRLVTADPSSDQLAAHRATLSAISDLQSLVSGWLKTGPGKEPG